MKFFIFFFYEVATGMLNIAAEGKRDPQMEL